MAKDRQIPLRQVVVEALRQWLEAIEQREMELERLAYEEGLRDAEPTITLKEYAARRGWHV
ncbi:MAG: hypothetical protein HY675_10860 [Chloroflexi bacterium]|nr:hypothetical protein [Chloroflexota bacterium]